MKRFLPFLLVLVLVALSMYAGAQGCSQCAAVGETSTQAGSTVALGINKGVLYLAMTTYLIIGTVFFFWWRARRKAQQS